MLYSEALDRIAAFTQSSKLEVLSEINYLTAFSAPLIKCSPTWLRLLFFQGGLPASKELSGTWTIHCDLLEWLPILHLAFSWSFSYHSSLPSMEGTSFGNHTLLQQSMKLTIMLLVNDNLLSKSLKEYLKFGLIRQSNTASSTLKHKTCCILLSQMR